MKKFIFGGVRYRRLVHQRGDTLIEVTIALAILSMTLTGSLGTAVKAFQLAESARERSAVSLDGQAQMEAVRAYRDNHEWVVFANGSVAPSFPGVLGASTTNCKALSQCFHMEPAGNTYVPAGGFKTSAVNGSYVEIKATPLPAVSPNMISFEVAWGFPAVGGGPVSKNHFVTQLGNLKFAVTPPSNPVTPGCVLTLPNLVQNGNFSISAGPGLVSGTNISPAARFTSDLPNRGPNAYPDDGGINGTTTGYRGGFSIQTGDRHYIDAGGHDIFGYVFPGDPTRLVPASNTYFYSNPNQRATDPPGSVGPFVGTLWKQTVTGLLPNTTYHFVTYFDNLLDPATAGVDPIITLIVNGVPSPTPYTVGKTPNMWIPVESEFTTGPGQTTALLEIQDNANNVDGDDFGMTGVSLYLCN